MKNQLGKLAIIVALIMVIIVIFYQIFIRSDIPTSPSSTSTSIPEPPETQEVTEVGIIPEQTEEIIEEPNPEETSETDTIEPVVTEEISTTYQIIDREPRKPIENCAASKIYMDDIAEVANPEGEGLYIRSFADTSPSFNIIIDAPNGSHVKVIDGPECNFGWILWKVRISPPDWNEKVEGWMAESDGTGYWMLPVQVVTETTQSDISTEPKINSCPGAPPQRLSVGGQGEVCTRKDTLNLRIKPNTNGKILKKLSPGTILSVIDGPECANNWSWWMVRTEDGQEGWLSEGGDTNEQYYLCPYP